MVTRLESLDGTTSVQGTREGRKRILRVSYDRARVSAATVVRTARTTLEQDKENPSPVYVQASTELAPPPGR